MVPHREPADIEISVISCEILCEPTVEPYLIKISAPSPSSPLTLLPKKENDKRTTRTCTAKALFISPNTPLGKLKL